MSRISTLYLKEFNKVSYNNLNIELEVNHVMDNMLNIIEEWNWKNKEIKLKYELNEKEQLINDIKLENNSLINIVNELELKDNENKKYAKKLRNQFIRGIWKISKDLQIKNILEQKVNDLETKRGAMKKLQKELLETQKQLKISEREIEKLKEINNHNQKQLLNNNNNINDNNNNINIEKNDNIMNKKMNINNNNNNNKIIEKKKDPNEFLPIPDKILLRILSYLEAEDVLAMTQVNQAFFTRIDTLFRYGVSNYNEDNEINEDNELDNNNNKNNNNEIDQNNPELSKQGSLSSAISYTRSFFKGWRNKEEEELSNNYKNMKLIENNKKNEKFTGPSKETSDALNAFSEGSESSAKDIANLANNVIDKLSNSEIRSILGLAERLKTAENLVGSLSAEREDMIEKLLTIEQIKEFLTNKLQDTEIELKNAIDSKTFIEKQRLADHEVISYLDERVHDLEHDIQNLSKKGESREIKYQNEKKRLNEQIKSLEEMLEVEKSKSIETEKHLKAQKKLLVREVKFSRAEIISLKSERDECRIQIKELRKALRSLRDINN